MLHVATAKAKHLKITARKLRLVADLIRGRSVNEALRLLFVSTKKASDIVETTLKNAVVNVSHTEKGKNLDIDDLYVSEVLVDEGATMKRWTPRAMGRASRILKRTSHIKISLGFKEGLK
ncbi:50S ribosomal protein L22 [PVC group bacterium (ex Bugula neritina AB1)]|nr:50S ribosomal protein L22 [PVC group bacterium (ex Bugula neritina AB1)]